MAGLSQPQLKRLTSVHGWSGTVLGLLLYAVVFTGVVAVFAHEIAIWSVGGHVAEAPLSGGLDAKVRPVVERLTQGHRQVVGIFGNDAGELMVNPRFMARNPETGELDFYGELLKLDAATGAELERHFGWIFHTPEWFQASALEHFIVQVHEELHIPEPWGRLLTGVLGLLSMAAAVSGIILHRHMIRDAFVGPRPGGRLVSARDRHVLAGTWALLFAFLLGFTGSYFSIRSPVVLPLVMQVAFGGDRAAMFKTMFIPPVKLDPTPARLADLDRIVADAIERTRTSPRIVIVDNWGRADARVQTIHDATPGEMNDRRAVYDGVSGAFLGFRPAVGHSPSVGSTVYDLMRPLHFGNFGGALSKSVWVGLGSAMAFVVISGLQLWVRRRRDQRAWRRFGQAVTTVAYGLPLAMLFSAHAFFLALAAGADTFWWTPAGFLIGVLPAVLPGLLFDDDATLRRLYRNVLGAGVLMLPVMRMATGGLDWAAAVAQGQAIVLSIDLTLAMLGVGLLWWARQGRAIRTPEPVPAE